MSDRALIGRVGSIVCAVPIAHVVETMRPLPVEPVGDLPPFVRGIAVIRGAPTVVVDSAALLGVRAEPATRFVVVRAGERTLAFTFDAVLGVETIATHRFAEMPSLAQSAGTAAVAAIGTADAGLMVVLAAARAIPAEIWARLAAELAR